MPNDTAPLAATATIAAPFRRAMAPTWPYWLAMLAASALGTNAGDLWAEVLLPGRFSSLAVLTAICAVAVRFDLQAAARSEAGYWIAIVMMRAAATNVADIMTHDLKTGYLGASVLLALLIAAAARFTRPDAARGSTPLVDGFYWLAMALAGVFGTVAGDMIHHTIGLLAASVILCTLLAGLVVARDTWGRSSVQLYWCIIMVERCAGTAVGDGLDSRRGLGLGLPLATVVTLGLTLLALWLRARHEARARG